jgi:hypothetical protein
MSTLINLMFPYDGEPYAWIITKDHFAEDRDRKGTIGPSTATDEQIAKLKAGEGKPFRMLTDDRDLVYEGRYIGPDDETEFRPLDDFGMPDFGCTIIQYQNEKHEFTDL